MSREDDEASSFWCMDRSCTWRRTICCSASFRRRRSSCSSCVTRSTAAVSATVTEGTKMGRRSDFLAATWQEGQVLRRPRSHRSMHSCPKRWPHLVATQRCGPVAPSTSRQIGHDDVCGGFSQSPPASLPAPVVVVVVLLLPLVPMPLPPLLFSLLASESDDGFSRFAAPLSSSPPPPPPVEVAGKVRRWLSVLL